MTKVEADQRPGARGRARAPPLRKPATGAAGSRSHPRSSSGWTRSVATPDHTESRGSWRRWRRRAHRPAARRSVEDDSRRRCGSTSDTSASTTRVFFCRLEPAHQRRSDLPPATGLPLQPGRRSGWNRWKLRRSTSVTSASGHREASAVSAPPNPPPTITIRCAAVAITSSSKWAKRSIRHGPASSARRIPPAAVVTTGATQLGLDADRDRGDFGLTGRRLSC